MKKQDILLIAIGLLLFYLSNPPTPEPIPVPPPVSVVELIPAEGMVAFDIVSNENSVPDDTSPLTPAKPCTCNGTKMVKSGDGIIDVPCPCGSSCVCTRNGPSPSTGCQCGCGKLDCTCSKSAQIVEQEPFVVDRPLRPIIPRPRPVIIITEPAPTQIEPVKHMYYFTASWCGPCQVFDRNSKLELQRMGWGVNENSNSFIQEVDIDQNPAIYASIGKGRPIPLIVMISDGVEVGSIVGPSTAKQVTDLWYSSR